MSKHTDPTLPKGERLTVRRLVWANVIALLSLLLVTVIVLWATGLLNSIWEFLF